jgi:hypothetical protein
VLATKSVFLCFGISSFPGPGLGGVAAAAAGAAIGVGGLDGLRVKFWPSGLVRRRRVVFGSSGCDDRGGCFFRMGGGRAVGLCLSIDWCRQYYTVCAKCEVGASYLPVLRWLVCNKLKQASQSRSVQRAEKPAAAPDPPEEILQAMAGGAGVDPGGCVEHWRSVSQ